MAYVKISDPKIIDLSTIHQIVNVVNQHSDNITALTNNFGTGYGGSSGTTINESTEYMYDISSQQIVYGKTTFDGATLESSSSWITLANSGYYQIPVTFMGGNTSFVDAPTVTVTMQLTGNASSAVFSNMFIWASNITASGFKLNLRSYGQNAKWFHSGKIYANWVAIGPKG